MDEQVTPSWLLHSNLTVKIICNQSARLYSTIESLYWSARLTRSEKLISRTAQEIGCTGRKSVLSEYILYSENTFYTQWIHSILREYILYSVNTFYTQWIQSLLSEYILYSVNTFYTQWIHSILSDKILPYWVNVFCTQWIIDYWSKWEKNQFCC